jgi:hypothetical protein
MRFPVSYEISDWLSPICAVHPRTTGTTEPISNTLSSKLRSWLHSPGIGGISPPTSDDFPVSNRLADGNKDFGVTLSCSGNFL